MGVLLVGSLNIDLVTYLEKMPKPGETVHGDSFHTFPGGKGLNQAVAAARAGGDLTMVGVLGNDSNSKILRDVMTTEKIDQKFVSEIDGVCGTAIIEVDATGQNRIIVIAGANGELTAKSVPDAAFEAITGTKILLAQLESPLNELQELFARGKAKGFYTILNPAPAHKLSPEFSANIDLLTPNQFEAEFLTEIAVTDQATATTAGKKILETGVGAVLITLGGDGALLVTSSEVTYFPAFTVSPIDTTAAGDAFSGALATHLSKGLSLSEAIPFASAAGALSTTKTGATPSLPTASEISSFMDSQKGK